MNNENNIELYKRIAKEQGYHSFQQGNELFFFHDKDFHFNYPLRKDGKPDMRFSINIINRVLSQSKEE